ncbi:MAG: large subunit ribosomal protein L20 [Myxococcota bacterium]|jgi:large subunit ribosomal protein L20
MARVKGGVTSKARHKKVLKKARGHRGARSRLFRRASTSVMKAEQYAYRDRRNKKRTFRALWIARINAAARQHGVKYSQLIGWLSKAGVELDRRALADIALNHPADFAKIVDVARAAA